MSTVQHSARIMATSSWRLLAVIYTCLATFNGIQGVPTVIDVNPTKGPIEGGTSVTIKMSPPKTNNSEYPLNVYIGFMLIPVESGTRGDSSFVITMPSVSDAIDIYDGIPQPISIEFSDLLSHATNFSFTYSSLTEITSFYPQEYIYTGGTRLTVYGVGLDIALSPRLEVSTISNVVSANKVRRPSRSTYQTVCDEVNATRLVCILPKLQLPAQVKAYLDGLYPDYNSSYRGKYYTPPSVQELINRRIVDDGMNNTMSVSVGLIFDGNTKFRNLTHQLGRTNGSIVLIPGPTLVEQEDFTWDMAFLSRPTLRYGIQGAMIWLGFSLDDVSVFIEGHQVPPQIDDKIAPSTILFSITSVYNITPNASAFHGFDCADKFLHIEAYIGYRYIKVACMFVQRACDLIPAVCSNNAVCTNTDVSPRYQCTCDEYFYGDTCLYVYPKIISVYPLNGPISGGTIITLQLMVPPLFKPIGIYIGNTYFPVATSSSTNFTIVSPSSKYISSMLINVVFNQTTSNQINSTGNGISAGATTTNSTVRPVIQWSTSKQSPYLFQYRFDPKIQGFSPKAYISTGGTTVTVSGLNLNAVARPFINVTMIYEWQSNTLYAPVTAAASFISPCTTNFTIMWCTFPVIDIPTQFLYQLDTQTYNILNVSKAAAAAPPSLSCPSPYQSTSGISETLTIRFQVGFVLDGVNDFTNVGPVQIYPPPEICFNYTVFRYIYGQNMSFTGNHLLRGVTQEDYLIRIADVLCDIVEMNNTVVVFRPNDTNAKPKLDDVEPWDCPDEVYPFHLVVTVAKNRIYYVGCVNYQSISKYPCYEQPCHNNATCNPIDTRNYTCTCQADNYGDNCENVKPILDYMWPVEGTTYGGTNVTIRGNYSNQLSPVSVNFFGRRNFTYAVRETEPGFEMVFVTERLADDILTEDSSFIVSLTFNDSYSWFVVGTNFTFRKRPTFTAITPRQHFLTGGTKLTIQGTNLSIAVSPNMTISVQQRAPNAEKNDQVIITDTQFSAPICNVSSDQVLICAMPAIDPGTADNFDVTFSLNQPIDTSAIFLSTDTNQQLYVFVILQFDNLVVNLTRDTNITNSTVYLLSAPQFRLPDSVINYYPYHNQTVELLVTEGDSLQPGADCQSDIRVYVGRVEGSVTQCTETQLWLNFPENSSNLSSLADLSLSLDNCTASGEVDPAFNSSSVYLIEVEIGLFKATGGCVVYDFEIEQGDLFHLLEIYVGVSIGAAVLIIVVIAIIT